MHRAFKISGMNLTGVHFSSLARMKGSIQRESSKSKISSTLESFIREGGGLDGQLLSQDWFPEIKADVFISHSHADEQFALGLVGWLNEYFGLRAFVDSAVWGNAGDLLRLIDNKYCLNEDGRTYNYQTRNFSTSHVHMMLNVALMKTMASSECVWFLNTPNSISTREVVELTTSPWIFSEIAMANHLKQREPSRWLAKTASRIDERRRLEVLHPLELDGFDEINADHISRWTKEWQWKKHSEHALDVLYGILDRTR